MIINVELVKKLFGPVEKGFCFFGREEPRNNQIAVLLTLAFLLCSNALTRLYETELPGV